MLKKGLSFTEIMTLESLYSVAVFLLEVPTGAIGDLAGRKLSLILAGIAMALGAVAYITVTTYLQFLIGEVVFACGMSLKSGSDTAIIYDSLKKAGRIDDYPSVQGKGQAYFLATQIVGSVVAGFLYELNMELPLILSAALMLASSVAALFFRDVKTYEHEDKPGYIKQIAVSGAYLAGHKRVRSLVIYFAFFFVFFRIGFWYYQPYLQEIRIETGYFGILFALFNIVATIAARFSQKYIRLTKGRSLIMLSILLTSSFILMGVIRMWAGILLICLQQVVRGVNVTVFMKYINKHIPSNQRATILSLSSLLNNLAAAAAFPLAGLAMDRMTAADINLYSGFIMLVGTVFFHFYLKKRLDNSIQPLAEPIMPDNPVQISSNTPVKRIKP
jgi:MFS family permease